MELYAYSGGTVRDSHPIPLSIPADCLCAAGPQKYILLSPLYYNLFLFQSTDFFAFFGTFLFGIYVSVFVDITVYVMNISVAHFFY